MAYSFESLKQGYRAKWDAMKITRSGAVDATARRILANKARYVECSKLCGGVPWEFIALCHSRESDLNFSKNLCNGQSLGMRTTIVPRGRGPYDSFEESAVDAVVTLKHFDKIDWTVDTIERIAYCSETFNGFGYQNKKGGNPYLWGGSDQYVKGKYVRDGVYSSSFVDPQLGVMPILKRIYELDLDKKGLRNLSGKLTVINRVKKTIATALAAVAAFVSGVLDWLLKLFNLDNWATGKDILETLSKFMGDHWPVVAVGGAALLWAIFKYLEDKHVQDYQNGTWTPSKMAAEVKDDVAA